MNCKLKHATIKPKEPETVAEQDSLALWHPEHKRSADAEECVRSIRKAMSIILVMAEDTREAS